MSMIRLPRRTLAEAASTLERIAPTRPSQPIYAQLYLEAEGDSLILRASNGELDLELRVPAEVESGFKTLVPAHLFGQLVRSANAELAEFRLTPEGLTLEIGSFKTRLTTADAEAFPPLELGEGTEVELPADVLARALGRVRYAAANEEYRAIFRGIQLELGPERFRAVATDGFRLALYDASVNAAEPLKRVVPARSADELVRLLKDGEEPLTLRFSEGRLGVEGPRFRMGLSLMEGTLPDYERVIPQSFVFEAVADAEALRQAIERVRVLADRMTQRIDLHFSPGRIELAAEGEYGQAREELEVATKGEGPLLAAFNAQYLGDALKGLKGPVRFRLSGPTTPSTLTGEEEPGYLAVVVPLRV